VVGSTQRPPQDIKLRQPVQMPKSGRSDRAIATRVGVLALQGAFVEHVGMLRQVGAEAVLVRLPRDLEGLDALILPGGESTTIGKLMDEWGLRGAICHAAQGGMPIYGTCAGMILMARDVIGHSQPILSLMDISVRRNAFGRQVDSFETDLQISVLSGQPFHAVFIRAPLIERVGEKVEVLASLPNGTITAAREGNLLVTSFHPELTNDPRLHKYFLSMAGR